MSKPSAALACALLLGAGCFAIACAPPGAGSGQALSVQTVLPEKTPALFSAAPEEERELPLDELQATFAGERIAVAYQNGADCTIVYAGELAPVSGSRARDAKTTIGPREAAVQAAELLLRVFGGTVLTAPYAARYYDGGAHGPLYFVTLRDTQYYGENYTAVVDAVSGLARYCCVEREPRPETALLELTAEEKTYFSKVNDVQCAYLFDRAQELWHAQERVVLEDSHAAVEPFIWGAFDVKRRSMVRMPAGDSYDLTELCDMEENNLLEILSLAVIPEDEWESYDPDLWDALVKQTVWAGDSPRAQNGGGRWIERLEGDGNAVLINAEIKRHPGMPAKTVRIDVRPFTQERIDAILAAFTNGAPLFEYQSEKTDIPSASTWKTNLDGTKSICVWADMPDAPDMVFEAASNAGGGMVRIYAVYPDNGATGYIYKQPDHEISIPAAMLPLLGLSETQHENTSLSWEDARERNDRRVSSVLLYDGVPIRAGKRLNWLPNDFSYRHAGGTTLVDEAAFRHPCDFGVETPLDGLLLSVEQIKQAVRDHAMDGLGASDGRRSAGRPVGCRITKLEQCWVTECDEKAGGGVNPDTLRLIPAWNVYGYATDLEMDDRYETVSKLLMTLSASNGTLLAAAESE